MGPLTLDEIEFRIYETYQYFAREAPGVTAQEEGDLGLLWSLFDREMELRNGQ